LKENIANAGYKKIYKELIRHLKNKDITASAENLDLAMAVAGEVIVPFLGTTFLVCSKGIRRSDGKGFKETLGSVIAHYILKGSCCRPAGKFVTFAELAGPLFKQGSYSSSALERPIIKRFQGRVTELLEVAALYGGHKGGDSGLSWNSAFKASIRQRGRVHYNHAI
jgi:Domain of unknown function (DUF3786)